MPHIENDGATIYYEVHGAGEPLVLAHGAGSNRIGWWQQVPFFSKKHRVIVFDHRCFGRSTCNPDDFSVAALAGDVLAVLDAEGIDKTAVIGHSMGGVTAMTLAARHADRISSAAFCHTPGCLVTPEAATYVRQILQRLDEAADVTDATLAPGFSERHPEKAYLYRQIAELNRGIASRVIPKLIAAEGAGFIRPQELADYRIPTLVLSAPADRLIPKGLLMHIAEIFPGARFVEFPTAVGHTSYFEDPDTFNTIMDEFLCGHHT